jgi:hypothetical protein
MTLVMVLWGPPSDICAAVGRQSVSITEKNIILLSIRSRGLPSTRGSGFHPRLAR